VTATLTVNTSAASAAALHNPLKRIFALGGSGTLAALLFFCLPICRRRGQALFGLLLLMIIATAATGCVATKSPANSPPTGSGTTAGNYIVTVTGASGSTKATVAVAVTVE
jgi:type IV secretory pathway VirB2 component (pilin)